MYRIQLINIVDPNIRVHDIELNDLPLNDLISFISFALTIKILPLELPQYMKLPRLK